MKWIATILIALMLLPLVLGIEDCKGIMKPKDIPCSVISSWQFPTDCNTYTIMVYNESPGLLDTIPMANYGVSGRCNITFNYTKTGSYLLNWSSGDSAKIIVERENNMIGIMIGLIFVMVFFLIFGTVFSRWGAKLFGYGVALIQLINIVYIMYINELNMSLAPILKINFISILWLAFGIGMISLIRIVISLVGLEKDPNFPDEEKKWGRD